MTCPMVASRSRAADRPTGRHRALLLLQRPVWTLLSRQPPRQWERARRFHRARRTLYGSDIVFDMDN